MVYFNLQNKRKGLVIFTWYIIMSFLAGKLANYCQFEHTQGAKATTWATANESILASLQSRLIHCPLLATLLWMPGQASHATSLAWLGLAWLA
jgi:hypothetical protein